MPVVHNLLSGRNSDLQGSVGDWTVSAPHSISASREFIKFADLGSMWVQASSVPTAETLRIMPFGDSITQGFDANPGYRRNLWMKLNDAGLDVDFVGSSPLHYEGTEAPTDFDPDHEGHGGWRVQAMLDNVITWVTSAQPDVVLLHAGTNDALSGQDPSLTVAQIGQLIDGIRSVVPNVAILLAQIIPIDGNLWPIWNVENNIIQINAGLPALAASKTTAESPVVLVNQHSGFNVATDTYDGAHPNASGAEKLAVKWYNALISTVPPSQTVETAVILTSPDRPVDDEAGWVSRGFVWVYSPETITVNISIVSSVTSESTDTAVYTVLPNQWKLCSVHGQVSLEGSRLRLRIEIEGLGDNGVAYLTNPVIVVPDAISKNIFAAEVYQRLPDYLRAEDEVQVDPNFPLLRFIDVLTSEANQIYALWDTFRYIPPEQGGATQVPSLLDPSVADLEVLRWWAKVLGITFYNPLSGTTTWGSLETLLNPGGPPTWNHLETVPDTDDTGTTVEWQEIEDFAPTNSGLLESLRWQVETAYNGIRGGTKEAIIETARNALTDTKSVALFPAHNGDPWEFRLQTLQHETPDAPEFGTASTVLLEMLQHTIPAGFGLSHVTVLSDVNNLYVTGDEPGGDAEIFDLMVELEPSEGTAGWTFETSSTANTVVNFGDRIRSIAGGSVASTHVAAVRRNFAAQDDFQVRGRFVVSTEFELPEGFLSGLQGTVRLLTMDNTTSTLQTSGETIGATSSNEWRVALQVQANGFPRLVSNHDGGQQITLWSGSSTLTSGLTTIALDFTPSQATVGSATLRINGVVVYSQNNVRTVPTTLTPSEAVITRVGMGIDDAVVQTTSQLTMYTHHLLFGSNSTLGPPPPTGVVPVALSDDFNDNLVSTTKWITAGGTVAESWNELRMSVVSGAAEFPRLSSANRWSITNKSVSVKVLDAGEFTSDDWTVVPLSFFPVPGSTSTWIRACIFGYNNSIAVQYRLGGSTTLLGSTTYNPATMVYFRVFETDGELVFQHSPNGTTWTAWVNLATPFDMSSCEIRVSAGAAAPNVTRTAIFDNFNILPSSPDLVIDSPTYDLMLHLAPYLPMPGWDFQTSSAGNTVTDLGARLRMTAGGVSAASHYARVRRLIATTDDFEIWGRTILHATFELPSNFHSQNEGVVRILTLDNSSVVHDGNTIGALNGNEWRMAFQILADGKLSLVSSHETGSSITIWTSAGQLSTGIHTLTLDMTPSLDASGAATIILDGTEVYSDLSLQTLPSSMEDYEGVVTTVSIGIEDAPSQDTKQLTFYVYSLNVGAVEEDPILPPSGPGVSPITLTDNFDDNSLNTTKWSTGGTGTVTEVAQHLNLSVLSGTSGAPYLSSVARFSLVDASVSVKVVDLDITGTPGTIFDDYSRADGPIGPAYTGPDVGLAVVSNQHGLIVSGGTALLTHATPLSSPDVEFRQVLFVPGNPGWFHGLRVRISDPNSTYSSGMWYEFGFNETFSSRGIYRIHDGLVTPVIDLGGVVPTISGVVDATFRAETVGDTVVFNVWVNNTQVYTNVVDSAPERLTTGSYVGLGTYGTVEWDQFTANEYPVTTGEDDWTVNILSLYPVVGSTDTFVRIAYLSADNAIVVQRQVGGVLTNFGSTPVNVESMVYFRIIETEGTLRAQYSALGGSWTTLASMTTPFDVSSCQIRISASVTDADGSHTATVDDFNILPSDPDPDPDPDPEPDPDDFPRPTARSQVGPRIPMVNDTRTTLSPGTYSGRNFTSAVALTGSGAYVFTDCSMYLQTTSYQAGRTVNMTHCTVAGFFTNGGQAGFTFDWCLMVGNHVAIRPEGNPAYYTTFPTPMTARSCFIASEGVPDGPDVHTEAMQSLGGREFRFIGCWFYCEPRLNPGGSSYNTAAINHLAEDSIFTRCGFGQLGAVGSPVYAIYSAGGIDPGNHFNDCVAGVIGDVGSERPIVPSDFYPGTPANEKAFINGVRIT